MDIQSVEVRTEKDINKSSSSSSSITERVREKLRKLPILDEIPLSAFESSSSSSSDTFESVNQEDLLNEIEQKRNQVIEEISSNQEDDNEEEKEPFNAAEDIMISLSDIPIEIDQGLHDKRYDGFSKINIDNGKAFRYQFTKEKEVKLDSDDSIFDEKSVSEFIPRTVSNNLKPTAKMVDLKSVNGDRIDEFKHEVFLLSNIRDLEQQMMNSGMLDLDL